MRNLFDHFRMDILCVYFRLDFAFVRAQNFNQLLTDLDIVTLKQVRLRDKKAREFDRRPALLLHLLIILSRCIFIVDNFMLFFRLFTSIDSI